MEEPTHISEMGIHIHPNYSWETNCADRTESLKDGCVLDSLLENSPSASARQRKPIANERRVLEGGDGGLRDPLRRIS